MVIRRQFLTLVASGVVAGCAPARRSTAKTTAGPGRVRVIAFDAFPIFDPRPVSALAERLFPGRGTSRRQGWRAPSMESTPAAATTLPSPPAARARRAAGSN
jgi:2-haloacid dehalogenase